MYNLCSLKNSQKNKLGLIFSRFLSSAEVATALRPFYFSVHPDLFGRFPDQRAVNEDSLKHLSAHLEALQTHRILSSTPSVLPFYVRSATADNDKQRSFKLIKIPLLKSADTKLVIKRILESCKLPTEYVDVKIKNIKMKDASSSSSTFTQDYDQHPRKRSADEEGDSIFDNGLSGIEFRIIKTKETESLELWMNKNILIATERAESLQGLKEEIEKLKDKLIQDLKLKSIIYDCGWNVEHFRGCLKSLEKLHQLHPITMANLEGRILVFASFTGVSLDGHIMLFTGDVQRNWLDLIKNVSKQEQYLKKIPAYEFALSQVLLQIKIGRRKFMPKTHASEYTAHLRKVTTTVLDYLGKHKYPAKWPASLSNYELVVESEAGPLMISPTGQIIMPSTCPGSLMIDFITTHLEEAAEKQQIYQMNKFIEKDLHNQSVHLLQLRLLTKDDSVTPERMIICLQNLIKAEHISFKNTILHITNYYSVLSDGTVCIPWDWK